MLLLLNQIPRETHEFRRQRIYGFFSSPQEFPSEPKMKIDTEYPFTAVQFNSLSEEESKAILAVADYLNGSTIKISDEELSEALNLMKPTQGCVTQEEADEDSVSPIRRKFAAVYRTAIELAEAELTQKGFEKPEHFNFCLIIDASFEHATQLSIVDPEKPICYLYEWCKAWHFQFATLADLAKEVLSAKATLVARVMELNKNG
jgi:hypothetical protein